MKSKFFISILIVFSMALILTVYATTVFMRDERLRLIDQQLEQTTSSILATQLDQKKLEDLDKIEDLLYETLSSEPPNLYVIIYDETGKVLYRNDLADINDMAPNRQLGWKTTTEDVHRLRSLTLSLGKSGQFLEVGLVLNRTNEIWERASFRLFAYIFLIFAMTALISYFLTQYLLRPIKTVSSYLTHLSSQIRVNDRPETKNLRPKFFSEFSELIVAVEKLKTDLEVILQDHALLFSQMTHELKTPLAIILNQTESLPAAAKNTEAYANIINEISYLSHTIQDFLEWSQFENLPKEILETDAIKLGDLTKQVVDLLPPETRARFKLEVESNFYAFAKMTLLKQLLFNLITNAIKYSEGEIHIAIINYEWRIQDSGKGISPAVMGKIGQPFNRSASSGNKSSGLGLAWVSTICKKYDWKLEIQTASSGTLISVKFPPEKGD